MRARRVIPVLICLFIIGFSIYLSVLFRQLANAFDAQDQFIPTRIFADVTRLGAPAPRNYVEQRLRALNYALENSTLEDGRGVLSFELHPMNFPVYLLPEGHPQLDASNAAQGGGKVKLYFDTSSADGLLQSVELGGREISDVYLEPELVAAMSRGNTAENEKIRDPVQFSKVPAHVWKAIIAVEDPRFMEHGGLDPRGFLRAVFVNIKTLSFSQGGSTITQQLVKNLMVRRTRNVFLKFNEIFLALLLEIRFEKERILERYLNEVYLGQIGSLEIHGVSEAAEHFFGKRLEDITLPEAAFMAGLIRGPSYYSPYRHLERALERQRWVLKRMVETGQIAEAEAKNVEKTRLHIAPAQTHTTKAPYFTDFVKAELLRQLKDRVSEEQLPQAGLRVFTTLDLTVTRMAQTAVATGIADLEKRLKLPETLRLEGALASVEQSTGFIRALIGGRSYAESTFNRILNMTRQVGSTFKPIVYLAAFSKGVDLRGVSYGPAYPMEDSPWRLNYDRGKQVWEPKNYEKDYRGWIPLRAALAHSVNTVAARLGVETGLDNIIKSAREIGITSDLPAVPSLTLGVAELSPIELLRAYAVIANHGVRDDLTVIRAITQDDGTSFARFVYQPVQVVDAGAADLVADMMRTVMTEGTGHDAARMGLDLVAAGKTGTTSQHRDAWFAGFTPHLTTVVWVGQDQSVAPKKGDKPSKITLTGAGAALPIWVDFMKKAHEAEPPTVFPLSPHLVDVQIDRHTGKRARGDCPSTQVIAEKYLRSHEPQEVSCEIGWPPASPESVLQ